MRTIRSLLAIASLSLALIATASAGNYGQTQVKKSYTGTASGWTTSSSTGGSQTSSEAIDNGASLNAAGSLSTGTAQANTSLSPGSATSSTGFSDYSASAAGSWKTGNATGTASSGGGTDVNAGAAASYTTKVKYGFKGW